ncbi:LysR family transcriptional regulator [Achromobacter pulmonis]|uniref:HTH-type transcriptional regulator DmlR n=1 Tax=Achromobacter pulmonis TaxID=1389932 RepID=A0A6S7E607_9BURK|nr:LysR family transcriptional regulator [Achromobacter pulmonis]CAB3691593.1 HTH-type transcriptional regulator DmlR [Achromobacter pulmonis]CAB3897203.1 HTH-type transcriptional regulator DmlR [Achromobacter pulmonis]
MDRLLSMEVFVAVVELGSLTAAAARHEMSAAMAAKHIKGLEARLGLRLMNRTTRRQSLTEAGQAYYARCKTILADIREAEQGAEALRVAPRGTLRITSTVSFGSFALAPAIAEYLDRYPDVSVELALSDVVEDLVASRYDLAVRIGEPRDSGLVARRIGSYQMIICASPTYLARHGTPATPADLAGHQCLDFSHWSRRTGWRLGDGEDEGGQAGYPPTSRFLANNGQALRQAALAGFGIVLQPELLLAEDVRAGRLTPILRPYWPAARPVTLLYPKDRQALPKLTTFVEFVVARFSAKTARR